MANYKEDLDLYYDLVSKGYLDKHALKDTLDMQNEEDKKLFESLDAALEKKVEKTFAVSDGSASQVTHTGNSYIAHTLYYTPGTYTFSTGTSFSNGSWEYSLDRKAYKDPITGMTISPSRSVCEPARKPREIREYKCKK